MRLTGTLTGNVIVTLPLPGYIIIDNATVGTNIVQFRAIGSGEVICIDQGDCQHIYNDGTNVRFVNLPPVGTYLDICDGAIAPWITNCTKPPYLVCDGSTFSAVTYPILNIKLGGNTLPDLRGVARYTLNQGTGRLTSGGSGLDGNTRFSIKTSQANTIVTGNLPPYTPSGTVSITVTPGANSAPLSVFAGGGSNGFTGTGANASGPLFGAPGITLSGSLTGGTPQGGTSNPFGVVGPGTISGITLIRAA